MCRRVGGGLLDFGLRSHRWRFIASQVSQMCPAATASCSALVGFAGCITLRRHGAKAQQ